MKQPKPPEGAQSPSAGASGKPKPLPVRKHVIITHRGFGKPVTCYCAHCYSQSELKSHCRALLDELMRAFLDAHSSKNKSCKHDKRKHGDDCVCKHGVKKVKREQLLIPGC